MNFKTHDKLKREIFAEKINKLINISSEIKEKDCSFVIALDSSWGTGKTMFIDMWTNKIISESKMNVITYNAWENDDFDKPIISILSDILDSLNENDTIIDNKKRKEIIKKAIEISKYMAKEGVSFLLKKQFGFDIKKIIENKNKSNVLFEGYKEYKKTKEKFIKLLTEISENTKIIFVIDELDRCNPLYAIELLETMKHFFNVDNIVFLIAIDIEQISHSIATIYGQNMDSQGYLNRFFDVQIKLPEPKNIDYITYILNQNDIVLTETMIIELVDITNKLNLSLRDMNRIIKNVSIMLKLSDIKEYSEEYLIIYIYLLILKYKYPIVLNVVMKKRFLNKGNSSSGSYEILEDLYFQPTKTIKKFMESISNGVMQQKIDKLIQNNNVCINMMLHTKDKEDESFDLNIPFYKYVERKLELYY